MNDNRNAWATIADLAHSIREHYQLAIWYAVRDLPMESAAEQAEADVAARDLFRITDAGGL